MKNSREFHYKWGCSRREVNIEHEPIHPFQPVRVYAAAVSLPSLPMEIYAVANYDECHQQSSTIINSYRKSRSVIGTGHHHSHHHRYHQLSISHMFRYTSALVYAIESLSYFESSGMFQYLFIQEVEVTRQISRYLQPGSQLYSSFSTFTSTSSC